MSEDQKQKQSSATIAAAPIPVPAPPPNPSPVPVSDDDLNLTVNIKEAEDSVDVEKFRDESKNIVAADAASDSVLKDLQDRAVNNELPLIAKKAPEVLEEKGVLEKKQGGDEVVFDLSELKPLDKNESVDKDLEEIITVDSLRELKPETILSKKENDDHAALKIDEKVVDLDIELGDGLLDTESLKEKKEEITKLEKVRISQRVSRESKATVAPVQTLMRTETIHDRNKKTKKNVFKPKKGAADNQGKTLDAVEELKIMSFDEWNRLGDIAEERIMKIKEKIEALGEKGVIEQIKGLNAWRTCQIMQEYLTVGISALINEKGIEDYFSELAAKDNVTLTLDEWHAINTLNSQLMI